MDLVHRVAEEASALKLPIYLVGGFVRDLLLGHPGLDFDLVIEGDAPKLADFLARKYGGKVTAHPSFRTAKWTTASGSSIDFVSARSEIYRRPAALPIVKMGSIGDDLHRRDFTINALAVRLDGNRFGELLDELGGLDDLQLGLVRVLHSRSFIDDPTRMVRAVRYEQRYGFKMAQETLALIPHACDLLEKLSAQRIRHELDLVLDEPNAESMLGRLDELNLLTLIHPALRFDKSTRRRFESTSDVYPAWLDIASSSITLHDLRWNLWLMALSNREIVSLNKRLHFTAPLLESLRASSRLWADLPTIAKLRPSQCVLQLEEFPLISVCAVCLAARRGKSRQMLEKYVMQWRLVKPRTTGHELKRLGLEPGPKYQTILRQLRAAWLDGDVRTAEEEGELLEKILH
ncbi:MAG TPA: hypothetical protein VLX61_05430 [Anaerolineales bacterium]|nr:hypothetical protein [Anaerolineales bacterium]